MDRVDVGDWVPMRWPWSDPGTLELLAGTPVSCLVVPWADGSPADEARPEALRSLVAAAQGRGLAVVGWVSGTADLRRAASAARATGLAALATESTDPVEGLDVLRFRKRGFADLPPSGFLGDAEAAWPGMRPLLRTKDVDAMSGATSRPWIDSNAWYGRLARALLAPRTLWLAFEPPDTGPPLGADAYLQAIADTEIAGARWMVSLDPSLRDGLAAGRHEARETWARIARGLAFFEAHRAWRAWEPVGQIGVVSDYAGENEFMAFEVLNLLARRSGLFRVLPGGPRRGGAPRRPGLRAVRRLEAPGPGPREEALRVRRGRRHARHAAGLGGARGAGRERRLPALPRLPLRPGPARGGARGLRRPRPRGGGRAAADEPPSRPGPRLQPRLRAVPVRDERRRERRGAAHDRVPDAVPAGRDGGLVPQAWARGRVLSVGSEAAAKRATIDGGVEFHLSAPPVYTALEVSA